MLSLKLFCILTYYNNQLWMIEESDECTFVIILLLLIMVAQVNRTNELHKRIAQTNRTTQDDVTLKNGNNKRHFGVLQSNSGAYGVPQTG